MSIALCMIVKDEANRIVECLDPIVGLVEQVVVVDTGSTDGTPELLRRRYGIEPLAGELREEQCFTKSELRERAYALARTDWILALDADERLDPAMLERFRGLAHAPAVAGYFGAWINHLDGEAPFEDYKLFLFRKGYRKLGLVHENAQIDLRRKGATALWLDGLEVRHFPEATKRDSKDGFYRRRLECALRRDPGWIRYHWFRGYMEFQAGNWPEALAFLGVAAASESADFPVECLNSRMVLAEIDARTGRVDDARSCLEAALGFHDRVARDFEVRVNVRMRPWLEAALEACLAGAPERVRCYRFAR
jgi:glycosyltransferase involved in cell wall biosynthesis